MFKGKGISTRRNIWVTFLICLGISAAAIVLLSLLFAMIAFMLKDPTVNLGFFSLAALLLGGATGGFTSAKIKKEGTLMFSALVALTTTLIMLIICVIMTGKASGGALMNYTCYIGVATLFSLLGAREKKRKHHRR